jgi:Cdc6-like AAA superfamily ATPase
MRKKVHTKLLDRWPGRRDQVSSLLAYLGGDDDLAPPLFLYGPPSTGKTSIVRYRLLMKLVPLNHGQYACTVACIAIPIDQDAEVFVRWILQSQYYTPAPSTRLWICS